MPVRALFAAAKITGQPSPYDTIHLKILHPGEISEGNLAQNQLKPPFPVVIFFNGYNCEAQRYQWLGVELAELGLVVVLFNCIAQDHAGVISLTPGVELANRKPNIYPHLATATALPTLLDKLAQLQTQGILAGMLDLQSIILGGHSEGGRVAMENANPDFFPQVVASFAYGAHTGGLLFLDYEPGTILPLPDVLPLLIMAGTCDGVIANSSDRYGIYSPDPTMPVIRTFEAAIAGGRNDSYLAILAGANHFSIADSPDFTIPRPYPDFSATQPQRNFRWLIAEIITAFIDTHVRHQPKASPSLGKLLNTPHPLIKSFERK